MSIRIPIRQFGSLMPKVGMEFEINATARIVTISENEEGVYVELVLRDIGLPIAEYDRIVLAE